MDSVASRGRLAGRKIPLYQPPVLQKNHGHHLLYFEHELLPRFNLTNTVPRLDLSILSQDPILLQSVVAVANAHAAYRSANEKALSLSKIQDRNDALRMFRKQLMTEHTDEANNSLFIANVLLCILDGIIEPLKQTSATHHHIVGGKAILKQWAGMRGIYKHKFELPILMLSIFATMDLTHALLIGDDPFFEASTWADFGGCEPWWGNVPPDDDFLDSMAMLSQLASLGFGVRHLNKTVPICTLLSMKLALDRQAENLENCTGGPGWGAFCASYRLTSSVYLCRALSGLEVNHELVQQTVTDFIEVVSGPNLTNNLHHCILFPLLIVGSHCLISKQRQEIRKSVDRSARYLSFESLRSLSDFLERRWEKLDTKPESIDETWFEHFDEIANVTCLF